MKKLHVESTDFYSSVAFATWRKNKSSHLFEEKNPSDIKNQAPSQPDSCLQDPHQCLEALRGSLIAPRCLSHLLLLVSNPESSLFAYVQHPSSHREPGKGCLTHMHPWNDLLHLQGGAPVALSFCFVVQGPGKWPGLSVEET